MGLLPWSYPQGHHLPILGRFLGFLSVHCSLWPQSFSPLLPLLGTASPSFPSVSTYSLHHITNVTSSGKPSGLLCLLSQHHVSLFQSILQGYPFMCGFISLILISLLQRLPVFRYIFFPSQNSQFLSRAQSCSEESLHFPCSWPMENVQKCRLWVLNSQWREGYNSFHFLSCADCSAGKRTEGSATMMGEGETK